MTSARTRAAMNKKPVEAEVAVPPDTVVTSPLRALLLDMAAVLTKHANQMPLVEGLAPGEDPPWDEGPPRMNRNAAPAQREPVEDLADVAGEAVAEKVDEAIEQAAKAKPRSRKKAAEPEPEPAEAEELTREQYEAQLQEMELPELRALAISMDWDPETVNAADGPTIVAAIVGEKFPVDEDDVEDAARAQAGDPDDLDEPDAAPTEGVTREELVEMNLPTLRQLAKNLQIPEEDYAGLDVDALADLIMQYQQGGPAEAEGEGEDEDGYYTEEDLRKMSRAELWKLATNPEDDPELPGYGYNPPKTATIDYLVTLLINGPTDEAPGF